MPMTTRRGACVEFPATNCCQNYVLWSLVSVAAIVAGTFLLMAYHKHADLKNGQTKYHWFDVWSGDPLNHLASDGDSNNSLYVFFWVLWWIGFASALVAHYFMYRAAALSTH